MKQFLASLSRDRDLSLSIKHSEYLSERNPVYGTLDPPLPGVISQGLNELEIEQLYVHQTQAIEAVRRGEDVVVVTPTASGKSLTYFLPIIESIFRDPTGSAILLFPLKALEQDQRLKISVWQEMLKGKLPFTAEIYDGDTPQAQRLKVKRSPPNFLITNPDMLHQAVLAYHHAWEPLLRRLKYIVIDELHAYRGIFGSHILQVLRRLARLCSYYDVKPQFICLSATIANPLDLAQRLTGRDFTLISDSGAPIGARHFVLADSDSSSTSTVAKIFIKALDAGLKTIVFTKARVSTEVIFRTIISMRPDLTSKLSSYRAGFLPSERRDIERKLATGELRGVISTSALELGIDIGGLDLCILVGYPGSIMSTWQRAGRVGRRGEESAIILVAGYDALDHYFVANPTELFGRTFESALINESNEEILRAHLPSAAAEIPLMTDDPFIDVERYGAVISQLEHEGLLVKSASGRQWFPGAARPHATVNLRNVGGTFSIMIGDSKKAIGEISGASVFRECHEGAIYLHRGEQYEVSELDLEHHQVRVQPISTAIYTMVRSDKQTEIIDDRLQKAVKSFVVHVGKVKVTETYHSYERRRLFSQELLSVEPLDFPPQSFITNSVWVEIPEFVSELLSAESLHYMGGIHATEHAAISLIPLFALCDRNDVGGISFTHHKQVTNGAIFFYDGYPGGAGIAEHVYSLIEELLTRTLRLIESCPCETGCPSCIQSPKCGAGNKPLDKRAAIFCLTKMLETPSEDPIISIFTPSADMKAPDALESSDWTPISFSATKRIVVFDIETQRSAEEVGGWSNIRQMRLAIGSVWDSVETITKSYDEAHVEDMIVHLKSADLVVGYNQIRFDYEVLRGYTFDNLAKLPTLDLLLEVQQCCGQRLKLDSLATATLHEKKSADGLQSLVWFKEGKLDLIEQYCVKDVEITRDILFFAMQNGYLLYDRKGFGAARIALGNALKKRLGTDFDLLAN